MDLKLYYHPLASYCWKVLITLYEADAPFERCLVDLADDGDREELLEMSPFGKFPALRDVTRDRTVLESSIVNEYLCGRLPSAAPLLPSEPEAALDVRARDRFFDLYVMDSMAKIVDDRIRPSDAQRDPWGVQQARERLDVAYPMIESFLAGPWATGDTFTLADCSAAPALYYADRVHPVPASAPRTRAYLGRLLERPSVARVLEEAQPYMDLFPG